MKIVGVLKNNEIVYDRYRSHISDKEDLPLQEALAQIEVPAGVMFYETEVRLEEKSGKSNLVKTDSADQIFYAKRPNRDNYSRFVKNKNPEKSNVLTLVLKKRENNDGYILITAFWGNITPREPGKDSLTEEDKMFWKEHAFVDGTVSYLKESIQIEPPDEWKWLETRNETDVVPQTSLPKTIVEELYKFVDPEIDNRSVNEYQFIQKQLLNDLTTDDSAFLLDNADEELISEVKECFVHSHTQKSISVKWSNKSMEGYTILHSTGRETEHLLDIYCKPPAIAAKQQMLITIRDLKKINPVLIGEMASCGLITLAKLVNKIKSSGGS